MRSYIPNKVLHTANENEKDTSIQNIQIYGPSVEVFTETFELVGFSSTAVKLLTFADV